METKIDMTMGQRMGMAFFRAVCATGVVLVVLTGITLVRVAIAG